MSNIKSAVHPITGSTLVLTYCKGNCQSQWKTPFLASHSSETSYSCNSEDYCHQRLPLKSSRLMTWLT